MRVASILCENFTTAKEQICKALPFCDAVELRLDYLKNIDIAAIKKLRQAIVMPVIFTLRKISQGGQCDMPEGERLAIVQQLAILQPEYLDLEFDTAKEFVVTLKQNYPSIQIIGSYHDFKHTPDDLELLFQSIYKPHFDIVKIATMANSPCDTLRLLIFLQKTSQIHRVIGMAMGEYGQASRILAPVVGSLMTYGSVDEASAAAPGQLTLREMTEVYHVNLLNRDTLIYALLGYPVTQSSGHLFHNQTFAQKNKNAVYVKLKVAPEKLAETILLLKQLPFASFSVTMPHKETVMSYLDEIQADAKAMGAVNTIKVKDRKYIGFNTDAPASVDVLREKTDLKDKKILILGAGGAAKAIAYALMAEGAQITLCNRTLARAEAVVQKQGGHAINFSQLFASSELPYDVVINTLPADAFAEQCVNWKMPTTSTHNIAMDIVLKPLETLFLQRAAAAGYLCIAGDALYKAQALRQSEIWFNEPTASK